MNKVFFILLIATVVSCSSSKPKVIASRSHKTVGKLEAKKPVVLSKTNNTTGQMPAGPSKVEVLEATSRVKVTRELVLAYIDQYKDIAKENMNKYGVPASIALGQGILESGAGTGALSLQANNHFGIKCHKEWVGPSVKYDDDAPDECFRKYEKGSQSYYDHSLFLTSRPWYLPLFKLPKNDYRGWAKGLKKAGYATDPKYPEKLIGLIERFELQRFDSEVLGIAYVANPKKEDKAVVKVESQVKPENEVLKEEEYVVMKGDTLYSISKKFNVSVNELKKKNDLTDNALTLGQSLKVK